MADDRRRMATTPRPQLALTVAAGGAAVVGWRLAGPAAVAAVAAVWTAGLVGLGLFARRRWRRLVAGSGFRRRTGAGRADLERVVGGRSVTLETRVAGPLAGTRAEVATPVEGVGEAFTVVATTEGEGVTRVAGYEVRGREAHVDRVFGDRVRAALGALDLPGTLTVSDRRVVYEVPFAPPGPAEVERVAELVVTAARRVEAASDDSPAADGGRGADAG